jgi:hypothetical protein
MSLFQKMLLGKYTKPCKDEDPRVTHSHQVHTETAHEAQDKLGLGMWLAQKLPAQALREFGSVTYEPPSSVSSDAISILHPELADEQAIAIVIEEVQAPSESLPNDVVDVIPASAGRRRYRSEEQQWQLETRIARLKAVHKKSA